MATGVDKGMVIKMAAVGGIVAVVGLIVGAIAGHALVGLVIGAAIGAAIGYASFRIYGDVCPVTGKDVDLSDGDQAEKEDEDDGPALTAEQKAAWVKAKSDWQKAVQAWKKAGKVGAKPQMPTKPTPAGA